MGVGSALQSRTFELTPTTFFARQDSLFDTAVEAVLGLGDEFLAGFPRFGAIETKATTRIDGCLRGDSENQPVQV